MSGKCAFIATPELGPLNDLFFWFFEAQVFITARVEAIVVNPIPQPEEENDGRLIGLVPHGAIKS